jgi:hypothetical protein
MPSIATLTNWRKQHPDFAAALEEAYEIRAETGSTGASRSPAR